MKVKALSLKQPYANLVASGKKTLETRTWTTKYRGDLLICASMSGEGEPKGVALCMVSVDHCRPMTTADAQAACVEPYPRANVWELSNLRILEKPFSVKGQLNVFDLEVHQTSSDLEKKSATSLPSKAQTKTASLGGF